MGKKVLTVVACLTLVGAFYCGGKQPEPAATEVAQSPAEVAADYNQRLSNHMLIGFPSWGEKVNRADLDAWAQSAKPAIEEAIQNLPSGYLLMIVGHASSRGPARRNQTVSTERAKFVHRALERSGVDMASVRFKGVGSSQPINADDPGHESNRRVSFFVDGCNLNNPPTC